MYVFAKEHHGKTLSEQGVEMFAGERKFFGAAVHEREVLHANDALQGRHTVLVQVFPHLVAHEQQACFAVVDDVVHIIRLELVQDGHDDGAVGNGGQKRHAPVSAVASAQGDFVAGPDIGRFEEQVHLGYFTRHVLVLQALSVEIRERFPVPVLFYAVFDKFYQFVFHIVWTYILVSETKVQKTRHIRFFVGDDFEFRESVFL